MVHESTGKEAGQETCRLGVLLSHPIQYFSPWFRTLAENLDLKVYYVHRQTSQEQARAGFEVDFDWDVPLLAGYDYEWLNNASRRPGVGTFLGCDVPDIEDVVERDRLDALLVFGWRHKSSWQAYKACKRLGVPILMKGDSGLHIPRPFPKRMAKWLPYRMVLPRFDGHLYIGSENRAYLEHYGVPGERLFFSPLSMDGEWFAERCAHWRRVREPERLRASLGIHPEAFVFLFVGRLISTKRPELFLRRFADLQARHPGERVAAVVVGDGPLRGRLERIAAEATSDIHLVGFQNQSSLPAYYLAANALVLPGSDAWGLVVNEAACCGVPAIVSDRVGCARDLIVPGETGFTFAWDDDEGLVDAMWSTVKMLKENSAGVSSALRAMCVRYGQASATEGLLAALSRVVHRSSTHRVPSGAIGMASASPTREGCGRGLQRGESR